MARDLMLAIGIPVVLLMMFTLLLEHAKEDPPSWLQRLSERPSLIWNIGISLIITLSLLQWLLQR